MQRLTVRELTDQTQIVFHHSEVLNTAETRTLADGEGVVIGRRPQPLAPNSALPADVHRWTTITVPGLSISETHLAIWRLGGQTFVRDLASSNGTRVENLGDAALSLGPRPVGEVQLTLAPTDGDREASAPPPVTAREPAAFCAQLRAHVDEWLQRQAVGGPIGVTLGVPGARPRPSSPGRVSIPLVDDEGHTTSRPGAGYVLHIESAHTVGRRWYETHQRLAAYVNREIDARRVAATAANSTDLVAISAPMREALKSVADAARQRLPLILLGETGTGKSEIARYYSACLQAGQAGNTSCPFEMINCGSLEGRFAEARIFGARRGAWTGLEHDIEGAAAKADGGTLFLDEVAELPLDVQNLLLLFVETKQFRRMGDDRDKPRESKLHIVCATSRDLQQYRDEKRFRDDLWYRLAGWTVVIPPLRERPEDIRALLERPGPNGESAVWPLLTADAQRLLTHDVRWPGNVRELKMFSLRVNRGAPPGTIDRAECERLLRAGHAPRHEVVARDRQVLPYRWEELIEAALQHPAFGPSFNTLSEKVLKPIYAAQAAIEALRAKGCDAVDEPGALKDLLAQNKLKKRVAESLDVDADTLSSQLDHWAKLWKELAPLLPDRPPARK